MHTVLSLFKLSFSRDLMYRTNFLSAIISRIGFLIVSILWFSIMYSSLLHVKDWSYADSMFFLGTFQLIETITIALFRESFSKWYQHINTGSLDLILTKPADVQTVLSLNAISFPQMLTILAPISLILGLHLQYSLFSSIATVFVYVLGIAFGVAIFYSIWLLLMTLLFWFGGISHWHQLFNGITSFLQVPPIVYQGIIKMLFYFILPVFTAVILPLELVWNFSLTTLVVLTACACVSLLISRLFFKFGLKRYNSASS